MRADFEPSTTQNNQPVSARWLELFEERHGAGSFARLQALLARPCVTFAAIAERFAVTRECVFQWHLLVMQDAPKGDARQQHCGHLKQRRRHLDDPLFRSFFVHMRRHGREHKLVLLRSAVGYRKRLARVDGHLVAIREGKAVHNRDTSTKAYALAAYKGPAEFLYVRLTDDEYLFLPSGAASSRILVHGEGARLEAGGSRNSFAALLMDTVRDETPTG